MTSNIANPKIAALAGLMFAAPFALMNAAVANRWEPVYSWIARLGLNDLGGFGAGLLLFLTLLVLLPMGALVALRPTLRVINGGRRRWYVLNTAVAALMLLAFAGLAAAVGEEVYRCDVLRVPNCD